MKQFKKIKSAVSIFLQQAKKKKKGNTYKTALQKKIMKEKCKSLGT